MNMRKNDSITAVIDGCTSEGAGVAHVDGMAVFVPCAIPGETAELRILKVQKTYAYAKIERLLDPSPERVPSDCPVYPQCGGCALRHMSYSAELAYKERRVRDAFERIAGVHVPMEPILPSVLTDGYRNRAQFPVAGEAGKCYAGFFRANTHNVIPTDACRLQTPEAASVTQAVLAWMNRHRIPAYDEQTGKGLIRHICVRTAFSDRRTVLTLVAARRELPHPDGLIRTVRAACPSVSGIVLNVNAARTNVILGKEYRTLWGDETLTDAIGALSFRLRPASFFQVNPLTAEKLYGCAKAYLTHSDTGVPYRPRHLLDLYCGTGTIGLFCTDVCERVTGVEIVESAVQDARENAAANGIENADFHCGDAGEFARAAVGRGECFDAVIVDPPRKGLSEEAAVMLETLHPERIVYVSCDPATLARDIRRLSGSYAPVRAQAVDMFPRTAHVETVCLLVRRNSLHIDIDVDVEEMLQEKRGQATYPQIKEYVLEHSGLKVSSLYISQIKCKCGLDVGDSYNKPKSEDAVQPQCPPEKEEAIKEALKYFGMI